MQQEIRQRAESAADRLQKEGLNAVDQLVGSFGPALEVYSRYAEVRTDTGDEVGVDRADRHLPRTLSATGASSSSRRVALRAWSPKASSRSSVGTCSVLRSSASTRPSCSATPWAWMSRNIAAAGLVKRTADKVNIQSAKDRRRDKAIEDADEAGKGGKVHPNDAAYKTAVDGCHALALRYAEAGGGTAGVGAARSLARQQGWDKDSAVARLMAALVQAAPAGVRIERGKTSAAAKFPRVPGVARAVVPTVRPSRPGLDREVAGDHRRRALRRGRFGQTNRNWRPTRRRRTRTTRKTRSRWRFAIGQWKRFVNAPDPELLTELYEPRARRSGAVRPLLRLFLIQRARGGGARVRAARRAPARRRGTVRRRAGATPGERGVDPRGRGCAGPCARCRCVGAEACCSPHGTSRRY
jgi:hypothetical protein